MEQRSLTCSSSQRSKCSKSMTRSDGGLANKDYPSTRSVVELTNRQPAEVVDSAIIGVTRFAMLLSLCKMDYGTTNVMRTRSLRPLTGRPG